MCSNLKKECDISAEHCKNIYSDCLNINSDMQLEVHDANAKFRNMRNSYLKSLDLVIKNYKNKITPFHVKVKK
jgi:hypothetical protein